MPNKTKQNTKNSTEQICSQPLYKSQTTHHTHPHPNHTKPRQAMRATTTTSGGRQHGVEREPDSVSARQNSMPNPKRTHTHHQQTVMNTCEHKKTTNTPTTQASTLTVPHKTGLPRKEVIQPHLPVRLPCYDFVPIANPTFDHSPRKTVRPWASGVTNFRDVTGGVYKARERIHRSVADLRLLATPPSWGRVADPNPN